MKIEKNVAYRCEGDKLASEFLTEGVEQGLRLLAKITDDSKTYYYVYEEDIYCMDNIRYEGNGIRRESKEYCENKGYKIIEYKGVNMVELGVKNEYIKNIEYMAEVAQAEILKLKKKLMKLEKELIELKGELLKLEN